MTIDELKEILLPKGFECVLHNWVGDIEPSCYLFTKNIQWMKN